MNVDFSESCVLKNTGFSTEANFSSPPAGDKVDLEPNIRIQFKSATI